MRIHPPHPITHMIPKLLLQTSKSKNVPEYVIKKLEGCTGKDWTYFHFDDEEIIDYFKKYALDEFPDIISQFNRLSGPHKADLFRYFFLYKNGGVYIDTDAMLYSDINYLVENYNFFTVVPCNNINFHNFDQPIHLGNNMVFNGFIGSSPNNEIIKKALYDAYKINPNSLINNYHLLCYNLYSFIRSESIHYKIKLLAEIVFHGSWDICCGKTFDETDLNNPILIHYNNKIIPE